MVATSHPLAVEAGLEMLDAGGTAVDAAVAAAAVLTVVDPRNTGLGGDLFALTWTPGAADAVGLASAGVAPAGMTVAAVRAAGYDTMPDIGPWSITVPGAPAGWQALLERFGNLGPEQVLAPAVRHAQEGFRVTRIVAADWATDVPKLQVNEAAAATFLPGGRAPREGETFANPDLARTLRRFVGEGSASFYTGAIAERIASAVEAQGGPLRGIDLATWRGAEWATPLRGRYRDLDVLQMPPPGQGIVALQALRIYDGFTPGDVAEDDHRAIESLKLAVADGARWVADPAFEQVPVETMLGEEHVSRQRSTIGRRASGSREASMSADTVYVAAVDREGGACSLIQSLFRGFGSGVGVPGTGLVLQNRGSAFRLVDGHPNALVPGKRPFHTIIPAMLARGGRFAGCLGVVGGDMQPQGHLQVLRNIFERGMNPQAAMDAPRFRTYGDRTVLFEQGYDPEVLPTLAGRGHEVGELRRMDAGGGQIVLATGECLYGGSDRRKDGYVGRRVA
jgi:gamma-glutamyltranspeptidase / glutathione hydrolase